jgi:hypothetical protein
MRSIRCRGWSALRSVIIPAVARGLLLLLLCAGMRGDALEDAARALAKSVAAQLAPTEIARVTERNMSSLPRPEAARAQVIFEQAIRRRVRNPMPIDITLTISENIRGYLLIANFNRDAQRVVEMQPFEVQPAPPPTRPAMTINRKLLWEQTTPILDLAIDGDRMLVLDTAGVTRYERRDGKWFAAESVNAPSSVRDPRGRMTVGEASLTVELPGATCQGTWKPAVQLECGAGQVFSMGRNTFAAPAPFFSEATSGNARLAAEPDGRTHIYDAAGRSDNAAAIIEAWGSDIAPMTTCAGPRVAVTGAGDRESADTVTLYDLIQAVPIRVSEPVEFAGPVTALWPSRDGAVVVTRNPATHTYEAYGLSADCGR